jgi:hypothetical protein
MASMAFVTRRFLVSGALADVMLKIHGCSTVARNFMA